MKVVDAGYEIINDTPRKKIERGARLCYKSEDFIKEGSDVKIITALGKKKHTAMFEHGSMVLKVPEDVYYALKTEVEALMTNMSDEAFGNCINELDSKRSFLRFTQNHHVGDRYIISGNMRAWIETILNSAHSPSFGAVVIICNRITDLIEDIMGTREVLLDYDDMAKAVSPQCTRLDFMVDGIKVLSKEEINGLSGIERMVHDSFSVIFTVDRGVTHEMVRMRRASFAQESTRYCNYSGDKFGNEITVIKPIWWDKWSEATRDSWERAMLFAEEEYNNMMKDEYVKAQQARAVLPHSLKVDIMVTAPLDEWRHIFALRACDATGPAHPQIKEVMVPLLKEVQSIYPDLFGDMVPAEILI